MPIELGENLSEYQALQAVLIASADNIADTLATWAFGSIENYLTYVNKMVKEMGLDQTNLADTSGLSPQTVSSAQNLVEIGEKILEEPVLAEIVNQKEANFPLAGILKNYNSILGEEGVVGIKTGTTDEAGGCLLFASKKTINNQNVTLIGAILGAENRAKVLQDTKTFLKNNLGAFQFINPIKTGQIVGTYSTPWGKSINILAKNDLTILAVDKEQITIKSSFDEISVPVSKNKEVGKISIQAGTKNFSIPAVLEEKISKPPFWWKLIHP